MKYFLIALQFLTVLPFKIYAEIKNEDYAKGLIYFPVVGVIVGIILSAVSLCSLFLPMTAVGVIVLIVSAFITGALHLDGFADTCDGFYGSKTKEETLKIMRDSRIGAMGAIGVTLLLLLKFSLITNISKDILWRSLIVVCCFSRWTQTVGCFLPYARVEGKAGIFINYACKRDIIAAGLFTLFVFCVLFGLKGLMIFFISCIPVMLFIHYAKIRIGGMTGDTIGAVNEIAEVSAFFFILIFNSLWN